MSRQKIQSASSTKFDHVKKRKKKLNHTQKIALVLLCILSIAFIQQSRANPPPPYPKITNFTVDPTTADVGEPVNITWTFIGFFDIAVISYGDGNQTQMTMVEENKTYTILHEYQSEGKYNVSIYVANTVTTDEDWDAQFITIHNDPPVFDISIDPSQADEDVIVNVSVTNLQESDHDKEPGLLTYVFDFADGNQTTSNSSSILHKWENGGTYPITITVIDDQQALNQKTQDITIGNKAPEPDFTIGCEIPSTYGFYSDLIGVFPFGWTSIDKHYEGSYSFVGEVGKNGTDISFFDSTNYGDKFVVIDEFNDHKEVLRCESYGYNAQHFECGVAEGTIEYWFAGWTEKRTLQYLRTDGGDAIQFRTNDLGESDFFQYYNGSDWVSVANASDYDWFHIRFDFDCVTDIYHIYVNEELVASDIDFLNNGTEIDNFYIEPDEWTGGTYYSYFDAFGFSWDPNYNVGDNLYAHESFDAFRVAEGADYHQKILEAKWTEFHDVEIYNTYEPQPNGTVEFWFMTSDTTVDQLCGFSFYDQGLENFKIFIQNSKWYYSTPAVYQIPNVNDPKNNTWHHVRIDFLAEGQYLDLNPSTFKVTIDGIESGLLIMNYDEGHYTESMHMKVDKEVGYDGAKSYIDAIGYSWDPHYKVGDNHKIFINEFYATFDFSEEVVGTEPSDDDWYIPPLPSGKYGSFSIVDAGDIGVSDGAESNGSVDTSDPNSEIVEIIDNSTISSLIMEHNYTDQAYGSVEFWVRSNNTQEKVWVFCLMQNDVLGLALLMDDNEWQYTISDVNYEIIHGNIDSPENDTWYHVRLDFRCTGADPYFSLQEGYFTVAINTILSSQFQMTPSLTSINRTRVTTGGSDTGTAYMDAIGYSWDPYYQIGDNRFPMVHYPEKSLIWFSASQTTDTSNDEGSLSYYWDFGDGSSDFGKYVAHEYPTSGMYPVELTVMDDNGAKASKTRIVLISNKYPDINFSSFQDEITTFEGTTITFDTIIDDENPDVARMEYYWHLNGSEFDPYNVTQYTQGGWINSYTFVDDHDGTLYAMARDPEGAFDFDALNVTVENVDPSVSIRTMDMVANVTFEVERSTGPPWYDNNFTFVLQSTDKFDLEVPYFFTELNFKGSTETTVNHIQENMMFDLLKDWNIYANTTSQVSGSVKYQLTFEFKDGKQEVISSEWISSGYAYWEKSLDELWYDETNFTIGHPVEAGVSIWDPSTDDVYLDLNYTVDMVVEIQCTDTLPISKSFNISDTYFYDVYIYESNGKKYVNITAYTQLASSDEINNEGFPLDAHTTYTLEPLIDLTELLVNHPDGPLLSGFSVVECISALNGLNTYAEDDDGGSSPVVSIKFDTQDDIDIKALCPDIDMINNDGGMMTQNISFYIDYYYRSYFREGSDVTFEQVSTYQDSDQETSFNSFGDPISFAGSGGDSGYVTTNQSTDSGVDMGSAYNELNSIDCSGTDGGSGYRSREQDTISGEGDPQHPVNLGSYVTSSQQVYTDNTDRSKTSSKDTNENHYPGNPGESFRGQPVGSNPDNWVTVEDDAGSWIGISTGTLYGHRDTCELYYDGGGTLYMYRNWGSDYEETQVQFWLYYHGADVYVRFENNPTWSCGIQFQQNGVYRRYKSGFVWKWGLIYSGCTDDNWYNVGFELRTSDTYCVTIGDTNGNQIWSGVFDIQSGYATAWDRIEIWAKDTAGYIFIDGYGETHDSGYSYGQNVFPYQQCTLSSFSVPMQGMHVDNYARRTGTYYLEYRVKVNYAGAGCESPDIYLYIDGQYISAGTIADPSDNVWYTKQIAIQNTQFSGDYDVDLYFKALTEDINAKTQGYTLYVDWVKTKWQYQYYTGTDAYYREPGLDIAAGTLDRSVSVCNNFQRDYGSFTYNIQFSLSQTKQYYVQLYKFIDASPGWKTIYSGTSSGSKSWTNVPLSSDYVEDNEDPQVKLRIYTTGGGNPFNLLLTEFQIHYQYSYTYYYRHTVDLNNMNEFRYRALDMVRGIDMDFDYYFPLEDRDGDIKHKQQNTAAQWQQVGLYDNVGDDLFDYTFLNKDFILYDGSFYVYHEQEIVDHDPDGHATECELDSMSHYYEWDYSYCDTFSLELSDMNDFRYDHFTSCDINYEVKTHNSEGLNIRVYNHATYEWDTLDSFTTNGADPDQPLVGTDGFVNFVSDDYILYEASSGKYFVNVSFTGFANPSETIFDIVTLEAEWDYSYTWDDQFEISLTTNMNDFRYDNFEQCTLSYTINTSSGEPVDIHLWDYTINDWVYQETVNAGPSYSDSITLTGTSNNKYINSSTYEMKVWFELAEFNPPTQYANSEFDLESMSVSWEYNFTFYDTYQSQLAEMTQFRYGTFTECIVSYNIDLIRDGKSTDVYLYNFTKSDWDFFKTTSPPQGGAGIEDYFTFYSTDYIDSGTYNVRIKFTGFTDTEFALNSIGYTFEWEYDVQDKFTANYDMDDHMYNTYESCTITFSITTSESQSNVQVKMYNYSSSQFVAVGSPFSTTADDEYEGSLQFTSDEFIHSTEYTTRIYFGIQDSYLTLNWMKTNYSWSHFYCYCDFGHDNQGMEGISYADMTAIYRNVYNASEVFDYAGTYLITWTVSDGVYETTLGQMIEITYPLPSVAIGDLPDYIIEDQLISIETNIDLAEGFSYLPPKQVFAHLTDFTYPQQQEFDITAGTWNTFPEDSLEFNDDEYAIISADPESDFVSPTSGDFNVISGDLTYGDLDDIDGIKSTITPDAGVAGVPALEGWDYVRNITLNPSTPENNYQVKVQLSTSNFDYSRVKSDGADLRFYTTDETLLNYWIESWNTTGDSLIWVKAPDSGTSVIHMYYGNSVATAMSNGTATFSFFDDFEGTSLDTNVWNEHKITRSGTFSVTVEDNMVKLLMNFGGTEMRGPWTTVGYSDFYTTGGGYGTFCPNGINALTLHTYTHEGSVAQVTADVRGSEWTWLVDDIYYLSDSLVKFYENETLISTHNESIPDAESIPIKFMCRGWDYPSGRHYMNAIRTNNNLNEMGTALRVLSRMEWDLGSDNNEIKIWVDWVFIHEINGTEPVASIGSELVAEYSVNAEVEWSVSDPDLLSIEALRFNHVGPANMDFYIWNYTLGDWVDITSETSPYALTTDMYNSSKTVKVLYNATSSSSFDIDIDQLRIDYTKSSFYKVDTSVEWSISDPELYSMDAIHFDHTAPISIDFYIWNYTLGDWLDITSEKSLYMLTADLYNTSTNMVKVRYISGNSVSPFDLQIDQLRIDYTKEIARISRKDIYQYYWDFGDGYFSVDRNPEHQYGYDGNYTATLCVRDLYGNCYNDTVTVEVHEKYPEIIGPYGFSGIEGQAIVLDVAVSDSIFDRKDLTFTWYDENDQEITEFANNQKPIVILNNGVYNYSLEVDDMNGYKDSADILITVNDIPPSVFIQNYMYHGDANSGSLTLTAYAFDYCEDINTLEFTWRISHNQTVDNRGPFSNVNRSSITFDAIKTATYQGEVSVRDPNTNIINKHVFYICSVIDSNGNGFSDEFEQELADNGENIYDYFDTDKDGISDLYEITHNETDYLDPDTDRDGLYDGVDRLTGMGERPAGTNPIDYDSDDDLLSDGKEVYGWEISTDLEDGIHVSSDPWLNDTDSDGWTDYEEYLYGTHPRNADTDLDGVNDPQDPYPLNADKDEDGLLDSEELAVGTDCGNSDTDEDTLTDGEEVRGGITNPLSADTDRDFVSDSAEVIIKEKSIQNRLSLDQPVILQFNHYFQHASAAQISFVLAFGEFNDTVNYGIEDVPDLNIKVSKMDNNLVLFEGNTNGDRYFSHAIDFREVIEDKGYNYYGDYVISVDKTEVGCMLEQFDINVVGLLDPRDADSDNDGIMDGIEMDTLTRGKSIINFTSNYVRNNITINNISPPEPYNFNIEVGSVQLINTIDQSVVASITFQNEFWFPVVVAYINSRNEDDSVEVRIDNVTSSGCDIFMEEPNNGGHASETINYIVVEYGEWEFPDGTDIKAGILATDQAHQGGSSYSNWEQVNFDRTFYADPIVLHSLNTYNNEDFKTSIVSEITKSSFNVTQESAETGTSTDEETIGWIAIESGRTGTINNVKYETLRGNDGDSDGVSPGENGHVFSFQQSFTNIPDVVVVKQLSVNENDGSWARSDGVLTGASHRTCAEEDQVGDPERNHADEYFGLVAFEDEFSYGYNYVPPEESEGSSYIKSVDHVELTLSGASNSAPLSKNQDITKCVPFVTMKQSVGDDWDDIMCDVYFTDSPATVVAERATTGDSITLSIFVVEFDGTNVEVQSGTFSATGTYDEQTIDQIDTSKAVPMACYKVAGGDDDWDASMVTTDFASDTTIRMERHQSSGTMSGHYYVFESQNSEFSVQKAELSLTASDGYDTATINWVNMSKSFIVSSYECDRATDDPEDAAVDVWLSSETEVRAERHPELPYYNGAPTINVFVVTFGGDDENVQRGDFTWANTDSFKETDITDINLEYSMVKSGQMYGIIQCDGTGSADVKAAIVEHKFVDNNTIRLERYTNSEDGKGHWEVVEFFGVPEGEGEEPEPEPEPFDTQYFSLEIPDWGTVYDANLTVTVKSDDTPLGYGTVNITLFKEDINCNIGDVVLIDYDIEFNETDVYFNQFIDLTDLVNDKTIHQFYGSYRLEIVIFDSGYDDVFNVTQFIIETDTYIQASDDDQNVWITDPSTPDTDGDTVSDYAEIYGWTRGSDTFYTNPLSADSDGDGAKDNIDRHPTENVMIKISPLSATHRSQAYWETSPKLEIAVSYELNGDDDKRYKIFTPAIRATEDLWSKVILFIRYSHYRRTNFAENDIHYYVDIDDNPNVQPENMDFGFSLWHMDVVDFFDIPLWDTWLAGESVVYSIGDVGHSTTFDIYDTGIWGQDNELHVKVETISVEKSYTIAIYDNETMFNGHYKEKEKMNVIVLEVTGNVAGTPFVQGPNAIVIPTELFVETKLNSYLERDKLEDTPLYSAVEGEYEFISVGRNGSTEEGCDEVDFVIIRFNINVADAMTVLSMLLTIIVNDTTGEEVEKYEYQSTKEDGADAVLMNLYKEVLGYIPWFCNFENSAQGSEPDDYFEFWAEVFVGAVMAVVYFIYMIGMAIAELFMAFVKFITAVVMAVLTFLGPLLWLIIRAILLILAFILLALHLVAQIPLYIMMGISMLIVTALMGGYCEFSWNFVEFSLDNKKVFRMQSDIVWVYWDYFDMKFPWVDDKIIIDGEVIMSSKESILGIDTETETEISEIDMVSEITQTPPSLQCGYNHTGGSTYNFYTTYQDFENNAPDPSYGVKLHLIKPDGNALAPYQMSVHPDYVGYTNYTEGILYNYTIDLNTIYQEQGLWHYYFTTEDNSSAHDTVFMPQEGYMLGPINSSCQHLISETVSTNYPDEYSRSSGFKTDNFTFVSTWWSEIVPDNVYMCLVPANINTGTGVSKTVGIQKFEMSPIDQSPDYNYFVDYYCNVNFTELGYSDEEIGRFNHYYEAIYDNGNKTYLYSFGEDVESEEYWDLYYYDFKTPYVGAPEAQLLDYHFDGANFLSSSIGGFLSSAISGRDRFLTRDWIVISEMQLRFEVIYMDPSGNPPLENYPQLTFVNVATGEELTPYVMDEKFSSEFSHEHGFDVYSYSCVIDMFDLPPGMWRFKFDAKDSNELSVDTLYGYEKLWCWGSATEMMGGFSSATLNAGMGPLIGYTCAIPMSKGSTWASVAAGILAIASTVYAIFHLASSWWSYVESKNAGALLGLCLGTFFSCLATSNAFAGSFGKIAKYVSNIFVYLMIVDVAVGAVTIPLQFFDVPWANDVALVLNWMYLPIEFFLLMAMSVICGVTMQSFAKQTTAENKVVKACMKLMLIFQALTCIASLMAWVTITEGWYLLF